MWNAFYDFTFASKQDSDRAAPETIDLAQFDPKGSEIREIMDGEIGMIF